MKIITIFAGLGLLFTASAAEAQDNHFSGPHISAGVSYTDTSVDQPLYGGGGRVRGSETGAGYRIAGGYDWRFGSIVVGGELGMRFGASSVDTRVGADRVEASSGSWDYTARAGVVVSERALIYGRLGGARTGMRQSFTPAGSTTAQRRTETADGLVYGAGVEYALNDRWGLRGEYSRTEGEADSHRSDLTVSAVVRF
jgi:outer membrane immunogenic protein